MTAADAVSPSSSVAVTRISTAPGSGGAVHVTVAPSVASKLPDGEIHAYVSSPPSGSLPAAVSTTAPPGATIAGSAVAVTVGVPAAATVTVTVTVTDVVSPSSSVTVTRISTAPGSGGAVHVTDALSVASKLPDDELHAYVNSPPSGSWASTVSITSPPGETDGAADFTDFTDGAPATVTVTVTAADAVSPSSSVTVTRISTAPGSGGAVHVADAPSVASKLPDGELHA